MVGLSARNLIGLRDVIFVMMSRLFMIIPHVYDDQRMTSWKEFTLFYVRLQGGSVYLWYVSRFIIINVKYGSRLESNLWQERLGPGIADCMYNGLIIMITLAV